MLHALEEAGIRPDLVVGAACASGMGPAELESAAWKLHMPSLVDWTLDAGGHLIDGGSTSLVPVRFARAMGADVVIAVDIYCHAPRTAGRVAAPAVVHRVMQAQSCQVAAPEMAEADVLIAPAVSVSGMSARDEQERAVLAGYRAAQDALPKLLAAAGSGADAGRQHPGRPAMRQCSPADAYFVL